MKFEEYCLVPYSCGSGDLRVLYRFGVELVPVER